LKPNRTLCLLSLIAIFIVSGCTTGGRPADKISFYILEYPAPKLSPGEPIAASVMVKRFSVAPLYNTTRMIFSDGRFKRNEYVFHRWRVNPGDMASGFLRRDMMESGLFRAIMSSESGAAADFILEGSVDEFLEIDEQETWKASLGLTITLSEANEKDVTKRIALQKSYKIIHGLADKKAQAFVAAMSEAMGRISAEIITDIRDAATKRIK